MKILRSHVLCVVQLRSMPSSLRSSVAGALRVQTLCTTVQSGTGPGCICANSTASHPPGLPFCMPGGHVGRVCGWPWCCTPKTVLRTPTCVVRRAHSVYPHSIWTSRIALPVARQLSGCPQRRPTRGISQPAQPHSRFGNCLHCNLVTSLEPGHDMH